MVKLLPQVRVAPASVRYNCRKMKMEMVRSNVDSLYSKTFWAMSITLVRQELRRQMLR